MSNPLWGAFCLLSAIMLWALAKHSKNLQRSQAAGQMLAVAAVLFGVFVFLRATELWSHRLVHGPAEVAPSEATPASVFEKRLVAFSPGALTDITLADSDEPPSLWLSSIGKDAIALGKWMAADPTRKPRGDVAIAIKSKLSDKYGNPLEAETLVIRWKGDDWARVAWATIQPDQMIALGSLPLAFPAVRYYIDAWCQQNAFRRWRACASNP